MPDPTLPVLPTLKRPRSSSNPPSPTGSSSSKKAASEDTNGSPVPALEGSVRLEVSPLANSTLVEESMTGIEDHAGEAVGKDAARTDVDGDGGEWVKMTEDVHLDGGSKGEGADGGERAKRLGKEKYVELYNELLGESFPIDIVVTLAYGQGHHLRLSMHSSGTTSSPPSSETTSKPPPLAMRPSPLAARSSWTLRPCWPTSRGKRSMSSTTRRTRTGRPHWRRRAQRKGYGA